MARNQAGSSEAHRAAWEAQINAEIDRLNRGTPAWADSFILGRMIKACSATEQSQRVMLAAVNAARAELAKISQPEAEQLAIVTDEQLARIRHRNNRINSVFPEHVG